MANLIRNRLSGFFSKVGGVVERIFLASSVCSQVAVIGDCCGGGNIHDPPFLNHHATCPKAIKSSRREGSWPSWIKQLTKLGVPIIFFRGGVVGDL